MQMHNQQGSEDPALRCLASAGQSLA